MTKRYLKKMPRPYLQYRNSFYHYYSVGVIRQRHRSKIRRYTTWDASRTNVGKDYLRIGHHYCFILVKIYYQDYKIVEYVILLIAMQICDGVVVRNVTN